MKEAPSIKKCDYEKQDERENEQKDEGYEMLSKAGSERTEKLNNIAPP